MGDGMVSMGNMIVKPNAVKIRRIFPKGTMGDDQKATLVGFAGTTADAFTLLERLEGKLDEYPGQLSHPQSIQSVVCTLRTRMTKCTLYVSTNDTKLLFVLFCFFVCV